jgi:hypothetical protein
MGLLGRKETAGVDVIAGTAAGGVERIANLVKLRGRLLTHTHTSTSTFSFFGTFPMKTEN